MLEEISKTNTSDEEISAYNEISNQAVKYEKVVVKMIELAKKGEQEETIKLLDNELVPIAREIADGIDGLLQVNIDKAYELEKKLNVLEYISRIFILPAIGFLIVSAINLKNVIFKMIGEPIEKLKDIAEQIADGNLNVEVKATYEDEIGELENSFSYMTKELKGYIGEISKILGSIADGNLNDKTSDFYKGDFVNIKESLDNILSSLNDTFYEVKEAAQEQASSIEQINEGIEQIADVVQANSAVSEESAAASEELTAQAETLYDLISKFNLK